MAVRFGVVGLLAAIVFSVAACDEPEPTQQRPLFPSSTAGTGPVAPACKTGEPCHCESGLVGQTLCTQKVQSCDCAVCEASSTVPTTEPAHFEACGGDVLGSWRLKAFDYAAVGYRPSGSATVCAADLVEKEPARMLLQLLEGGTGDVFLGGLSNPRVVLESCLAEGGSTNFAGCLPLGTCGLLACGEVAPYGYFPYGFGWQLVGKTLKLTGNSGDLVSYEYCVNGNHMTLRPLDLDYLMELERAEFGGAPLPCAQRSPETCVVPTNPKNPARHTESEDDACHFACTGGPNCETVTYDTACEAAGCVWDVTQCAGEPASECLFGDYDALPGCVATPVAAP